MKTPLIAIDILSVYKNRMGDKVPLPVRMARCTPDTYQAIFSIARELAAKGGRLILSDLFRSYEMQTQAHADYVTGRKKAYSPAPGGSFHEAGRGFDLDLKAIKIPLAEFWEIARKYGVVPIIAEPKPTLLEAWHFDCPGSHQLVYDYYAAGNGKNMKPYTAAAASAILSIGVNVDTFGEHQQQAAIQSCLIRLGKTIGNIDGLIGHRTQQALAETGIEISLDKPDRMLAQIENLVQQKFPGEFVLPDM